MVGQGPDPDQITAYDATYQVAGAQCSSTFEGRHVNIIESLLVHPAHADGLADHGDPVLVGWSLVGVTLKGAEAATDVVPVDTEGIWYLMVEADWANINIGDMLFIDATTAVVSDDWEDVPFGHALAPVVFEATTLIAVKVHAFQILFPWWLFP